MTRKKTEEQDIEPAQSKDGSNIEPQAPAGNSPAKAAPTARSQGKGYALVAVVYLLGLCMGALDMGIVNPARTVIQNTLSVDDSLGVLIITIYTLAYAVSIPIMGKLADRHGRKGVYLLCILLFGIGSALCGVAQDLGNFWILIGARVIQALGGGGIMPVATAEFGTAFPEEKRGMALGIVGMVYGLASILGPTVGSAILEVFGATQWQFIFYVNIPICIIVLILGVKRLPNAQAEKTGPLDGLGILILTLMTLSLMYGLKNIDFFDFATSIASTDVWPFLVAFVVLLPLFVLRERHAADPILNLKYFTNANIVIAFLCAVISGIAMMGTIFFPQFCENAMMMKSGSGGYFIALLGVGSGVGAMMSGKLIDKHGVKPVLAMGFIGVAIGSIFMAFVACTWPSLLTVCATIDHHRPRPWLHHGHAAQLHDAGEHRREGIEFGAGRAVPRPLHRHRNRTRYHGRIRRARERLPAGQPHGRDAERGERLRAAPRRRARQRACEPSRDRERRENARGRRHPVTRGLSHHRRGHGQLERRRKASR